MLNCTVPSVDVTNTLLLHIAEIWEHLKAGPHEVKISETDLFELLCKCVWTSKHEHSQHNFPHYTLTQIRTHVSLPPSLSLSLSLCSHTPGNAPNTSLTNYLIPLTDRHHRNSHNASNSRNNILTRIDTHEGSIDTHEGSGWGKTVDSDTRDPGFESQTHHLHFFNLHWWNLNCIRYWNEKTTK